MTALMLADDEDGNYNLAKNEYRILLEIIGVDNSNDQL